MAQIERCLNYVLPYEIVFDKTTLLGGLFKLVPEIDDSRVVKVDHRVGKVLFLIGIAGAPSCLHALYHAFLEQATYFLLIQV